MISKRRVDTPDGVLWHAVETEDGRTLWVVIEYKELESHPSENERQEEDEP
jgi:hypothetical protein